MFPSKTKCQRNKNLVFSGSVKHILLEEDELSQSSTVNGKAVSKGNVLIAPDDTLTFGDGLNDETCNDENERVFFRHDSEDEDEDEMDDDDEEYSAIRLKGTNMSRRKFVKPGKAKSYSCNVEGCSKTYTALHHLKVSLLIKVAFKKK